MRRAQNIVTYAELERLLRATGRILCVVDNPASREVVLVVTDDSEEAPGCEAPVLGRPDMRSIRPNPSSLSQRSWA